MYFDSETGLLVRMIRYGNSPIGRVPTQVDIADYRDVAGIKLPSSGRSPGWTDATRSS